MYFAHFLNKVLEKGIYLERYRRDEVKGAIESSRALKDYDLAKLEDELDIILSVAD